MDAQSWLKVQDNIRSSIGEDDFNSWLLPAKFVSFAEGRLTLTVPTVFFRDWISRHYSKIIKEAVSIVENNIEASKVDLNLVVKSAISATPLTSTPASNKTLAQAETTLATSEAGSLSKVADEVLTSEEIGDLYDGTPLDPRFTFENFVTGKSNEFAYAAARRIAESDDMAYNPFFLYGGVGLGKTHLMHAIAHHILEHQSSRKVLYISAEKFLYQFIRALRDKSTLSFKETFRSVDVLMIDDVQFIAGKDATQEEFFHTFNSLVNMRKQVILTADRSPHELQGIEDRLRSRLGSGLATEIHSPDLETRLAILEKKAETLGLDLTRDVTMFLADGISSNIRELEGALKRLAAHADLLNTEITIDFASEVLRDLFRVYNRTITLDEVQKKVADYYNVKIADLHSARRTRTIARPRQIAMYLSKQLTTKSFPDIGRSMGGRDHTTVIHAVKAVEKLIAEDPSIAEDLRLLEKMLKNR